MKTFTCVVFCLALSGAYGQFQLPNLFGGNQQGQNPLGQLTSFWRPSRPQELAADPQKTFGQLTGGFNPFQSMQQQAQNIPLFGQFLQPANNPLMGFMGQFQNMIPNNIRPSLNQMPSIPQLGNPSEMLSGITSQVPAMPSLPELPAMPSLPEAPAMPSVPELPAMPSLPELPDMPSLPESPISADAITGVLQNVQPGQVNLPGSDMITGAGIPEIELPTPAGN